MTTNINPNVLKNFIVRTLGSDKVTAQNAQKYDIDKDKFAEANTDENDYLEIDEILDNSDLYEQFATMCVEDLEQKAEANDEEKEKEEAGKVKEKGESKA